MPYWVYSKWLMLAFFIGKKDVRLLEIGVDTGRTFLELSQNLLDTNRRFHFIGVDIREDEDVVSRLNEMKEKCNDKQKMEYVIANSLEWMPECPGQFDVVFIDGDHNYYTVQQELEHLDRLVKPDGVALVDDFNGKWSKRDLFYSTRETHEGIENMTEAINTEKHGVRPAILDFLKENKDWIKIELTKSEAVILTRRENKKSIERGVR